MTKFSNFDVSRIIIHYEDFFHSNISMATFCQGRDSKVDGIKGSAPCD